MPLLVYGIARGGDLTAPPTGPRRQGAQVRRVRRRAGAKHNRNRIFPTSKLRAGMGRALPMPVNGTEAELRALLSYAVSDHERSFEQPRLRSRPEVPRSAPDVDGPQERVFGIRQLLALAAILLTLVVVMILAKGDHHSASEAPQPVEAQDVP